MAPPTQPYPRSGYLLVLLGGIVTIALGIVTIAAAYSLGSEIAAVGGGAVTAVTLAELVVGVLLGGVLVYLALRLKGRPTSSKPLGIGVIALALVSLFVGGGGLFIGSILAIVGGAIAYSWKPPTASPTGWAPAGGVPPSWNSVPLGSPTPPLSGAGKFCPYCGVANPATARFCARCGAAFPG
ncbi:MAG TPA: DUF6114 domain-containing protein [Thermoplasmata archaeon]|nr:DUF6114 domain-containing protein [Thermoplasmata archaeon]